MKYWGMECWNVVLSPSASLSGDAERNQNGDAEGDHVGMLKYRTPPQRHLKGTLREKEGFWLQTPAGP
jgi:hypothetical protein